MSPYDRRPPRNGNLDRNVAQARKNRSLQLPPAQSQDHPEGSAAADFLEGLGAGGPRANMIRNIQCAAAARRMSDQELADVSAFLVRQRERDAARFVAMGAPAYIVENARRPGLADKVLEREQRKRASRQT